MQGVRNGQNPTVIMRTLKTLNSDIPLPKKGQLYNKMSYVKTLLAETQEIINTGDMREAIEKKLEVPIDLDEAFVCHHEVKDDEGPDNVRFVIIFTSQKMQARVSNEFCQDDATYRVTWQNFPIFVSGRSSSTGKFFPTHVTLSSHEDSQAWASAYSYIKDKLNVSPKFRMADGASEISKAGREVKKYILFRY